jgi:hypothetical protein
MTGSNLPAQYLSIQCSDVSDLYVTSPHHHADCRIEAIRKSGGRLNDFAVLEMHDYLRRIGYQPDDLNKLNVVHITGTKGKGSTSAFTERILRSHLSGKVGLYTSPHLCAVRERIRVNGEPLSEEVFAKLFFEVWEKLENDQKVSPHHFLQTLGERVVGTDDRHPSPIRQSSQSTSASSPFSLSMLSSPWASKRPSSKSVLAVYTIPPTSSLNLSSLASVLSDSIIPLYSVTR